MDLDYGLDLNHVVLSFRIDCYKRDKNWSMPGFHLHNIYEIVFFEEGESKFIIGGSVFEVERNHVILIRPNEYHKNTGNDYTRTCIYFTESFLQYYFTGKSLDILLECFNSHVISLDDESFLTIKNILKMIEKENINNHKNNIFAYIANIFILLNNKALIPREPVSLCQKEIAPILNHINQNFSTIQNINEIADYFFISKYHLCRNFKNQTGMTIIQYLNNTKTRKACDLLINSNYSIKEIGRLSGYKSHTYFFKVFKELTKMSPNEYRKQNFKQISHSLQIE